MPTNDKIKKITAIRGPSKPRQKIRIEKTERKETIRINGIKCFQVNRGYSDFNN
jgi:hypothetical protein